MKIGKKNCKLNCRITNWEVKDQEKQMAQMAMISRYWLSRVYAFYSCFIIKYHFHVSGNARCWRITQWFEIVSETILIDTLCYIPRIYCFVFSLRTVVKKRSTQSTIPLLCILRSCPSDYKKNSMLCCRELRYRSSFSTCE